MALANDEDGKIGKIDKVGATKVATAVEAIAQPEERVAPNKEHFDALLTGNNAQPLEPVTSRKVDTGQVSLIDEVAAMDRRVNQIGHASTQDLVVQADGVINQIHGLKQKLSAPNLEVKDSMQGMLRNKLSHIDESLKVTLNRAGIEYTEPVVKAAGPPANPIERFLGLLTRSQNQLETLSNELHTMGVNRTELSPATMLLLQIKVGFISQEVELFTSLLSKALESTKTIMNVQV